MMLSSSGHHEDIERCRSLGIAAYLTKPIAAGDLLEAIRNAIAPRTPSTAATADALTAPANRRAAHARQILLAEDNIVNQRVAVGLLTRRGHHVTVVANGREALDAVARERFDLVLMDLQMPVMSGIEATAAIRAREADSGGHLWIVAMTAHVMPGDQERCLVAGMDSYLGKPIDPKALFAEVEDPSSHVRSAATSAVPSGAPSTAPTAPTGTLVVERSALDRGDLFQRLSGDEGRPLWATSSQENACEP